MLSKSNAKLLQGQASGISIGTFIEEHLLFAQPGNRVTEFLDTGGDIVNRVLDRNGPLDTAANGASGIPWATALNTAENILTAHLAIGASLEFVDALVPGQIITVAIAADAFEVVVGGETINEFVPDIKGFNSGTGEASAAAVSIPARTGDETEVKNSARLIAMEAGVVGVHTCLEGRVSAGIITVGAIKVA